MRGLLLLCSKRFLRPSVPARRSAIKLLLRDYQEKNNKECRGLSQNALLAKPGFWKPRYRQSRSL